MVVNKYQNFLLYQVANAQIRSWPWIHVVFDQLFHADQYDQIMRNLPDAADLKDIRTVNDHPDHYSAQRFILTAEKYTEFWTNLEQQFLNGQLKAVLLKKLSAQIKQRLEQAVLQNTEFYDTFQLTLDKPGYDLKPHPDVFNKIFTIVINLPQTDANSNQGTVIYNGPERQIIYESEFKPNTGFGVFRTNDSWHGIEPTTADRWTIQYVIWGRDKTH
jgi:hypothetical protein